MTINAKFKALLKEKGVSQASLAAAMGISQQQMSYILGRDEADMTVGFVRSACAILGVPPARILLDGADVAEVSGVSAAASPIVDELKYAADNYAKTECKILFTAVLGLFRAYRTDRAV